MQSNIMNRLPVSAGMRRLFSQQAQRTSLHELHVSLGGKYKDGVMQSHLHTRQAGCSSVFDVSHMGQVKLHGADRVAFLESLVCGDIAALREGQACLSLLTNEKGGIIDDTVITNAGDHISMVVNGACKVKDIAHMREHLAEWKGSGKDVSLEWLEDQQLIALQGPGAAAALSKLLPSSVKLSGLGFMEATPSTIDGKPVLVTRCGYTGEDGFEISMTPADAVALTELVLAQEGVKPAGLGARDSLRMEAGLCLYGHDIDDTTTPVDATLMFTIAKRRRAEGGFLGSDVIVGQINDKSLQLRKRIGLALEKAPAREGCKILSEDGSREVGTVTSGSFSPCLKHPISMGYVEKSLMKAGTKLKVDVRGKLHDATVTKMPFVPANYYRKPE